MPTTADSARMPELSFAGTVDRRLLHRRHPDEAFLTDAVRTGPDRFAAAALLPAQHPHYTGHTGPSRHRDPMLLLECARQAETYAAHAIYGVALGEHFVLRDWSAQFIPAAPDPAPGPPGGPTELLLTAVTGDRRLIRGRIRELAYRLEMWVAGARVGRVRMAVGYLSHRAYTALRSRTHPGALPCSDDLVGALASAAGSPVDPARVGRLRATDAVLLDVAAGSERVTARLRVPVENTSLFDHAQDHIPAMVLMEAARQVAALATGRWGGADPDRTAMAALSASFHAYAELTEPVELAATPVAAAGAGAPGRPVAVTFRQAGVDIARARLAMVVPAPLAGCGTGGDAAWYGRR